MPSGQLPRTLQPPPELPDDPTLSTVLAQYLRTFSLWCRHGFGDKLSGTTAQPGLMLQAFNPPAGVQPTVWMVEVGQGGNLHTQQISLASGDLGTPIRAGTAGVTDGSNATPGQIGEVLSATNTITLSNGVSTNVVSLPLTPGDWDVHGDVWVNVGTGGLTSYQACISNASVTFPGGVSAATSRTSFAATLVPSFPAFFPLRTSRANATVNTTYYAVANVGFPSGTVTANACLWARRAR